MELNLETMRDKLIFLAGIIDGEGHFYKPLCTSGHNSKYKQPRIVVTNTNKDLINWIVDNFGGYVYKMKIKSIKHKQAYQWVIDGNRAVMVASWVQPFLIVKKEQVKRVLN